MVTERKNRLSFANHISNKKDLSMRIFAFGMLLLIASCQNGSKVNANQSGTSKTLVGADRDPHDCIGSAGYTWSVVKNGCIRVFEEGTAFVKYDVATGLTDSSMSAFLVLSGDKQKAEVFLGNKSKSVVMSALPQMEGEIMPVLFENKTERLKLRSYRDIYQLLFLDTVRYVQYYNAKMGLGKWLMKGIK